MISGKKPLQAPALYDKQVLSLPLPAFHASAQQLPPSLSTHRPPATPVSAHGAASPRARIHATVLYTSFPLPRTPPKAPSPQSPAIPDRGIMSQIRVLSSLATLPFHPPSSRRPLLCSGGAAARCRAEGLVAGRTSGIGLNWSPPMGLAAPSRLEVAFLGGERRGNARGDRVVCAAAAALNPQSLHWVSAIATLVLMFAKGTPIIKSFLPVYFILQAPACALSWFKSEYGAWTALLALLVRLFYPLPEELELPFMAMLLSVTSPTQTLNLRGTPAAAIISVVIAGYLAYQHFTKMGNVQNAFDSVSIASTLALIAITLAPLLLLFIY